MERSSNEKKRLCLIVCFFLSACSKASNQTNSQILVLESQVNQLQVKLSRLEESLDACQKELASLQIQNSRIQEELMEMELGTDVYSKLSNLSLDFVRAHTSGDVESLQALIGDSIRLQAVNGVLLATWEEDGQKIEWELWRKDDSRSYKDMVIQGFGQLESSRYVIHIREFYTENAQETSPPTFLNLHFQQFDGQWKVVYFEFDV